MGDPAECLILLLGPPPAAEEGEPLPPGEPTKQARWLLPPFERSIEAPLERVRRRGVDGVGVAGALLLRRSIAVRATWISDPPWWWWCTAARIFSSAPARLRLRYESLKMVELDTEAYIEFSLKGGGD